MLVLAIDVDFVRVPSTALQMLVVLLLLTAVMTALIMGGTTVLSGWVDKRWPATEPLRPSELLWGEVGGHVAKTFRGLDLEMAKDLAGAMVEVKVPAGEYIVEQGDAPTHYYVMKSGDAEVVQRIFSRERGEIEQSIRRYGPGDAFGEVAILRRTARTASVRAVSDCVVMQLPAEDFVAGTTLSAADENQLLAAVDRYLAEDRARMRAAGSAPVAEAEPAPEPESRAERRRRRLAEQAAAEQAAQAPAAPIEPAVEAVTPVAASTAAPIEPEVEVGTPAPGSTPGSVEEEPAPVEPVVAKKAARPRKKAAAKKAAAKKAAPEPVADAPPARPSRRGRSIAADDDPAPQPAPQAATPPTAPPTPFFPSHRAPAAGLQVWDAADPSQPVREIFAPGTEVQVVERWGEWAHVRRADGAEGWVDGRVLEAR